MPVTPANFRAIALAFEGVTEAPHFDRTAFRAARIFATLAAEEKSANLNFAPAEQEFKCLLAPEAFSPVPGGWGRLGWTTCVLAKVSQAELKAGLELAYEAARKKPGKKRR